MTPAFGGQYSIQLSYGRYISALRIFLLVASRRNLVTSSTKCWSVCFHSQAVFAPGPVTELHLEIDAEPKIPFSHLLKELARPGNAGRQLYEQPVARDAFTVAEFKTVVLCFDLVAVSPLMNTL